MTKKDYVLLTSMFHEAKQYMSAKDFRTVMDHACALLRKDNPNFREVTFRDETDMPRTFMSRTLRDG